jgi:hypothetical protein
MLQMIIWITTKKSASIISNWAIVQYLEILPYILPEDWIYVESEWFWLITGFMNFVHRLEL